MCRDGGSLWECDEERCSRVVCGQCVVIPEEFMIAVLDPDVQFKCTSCHWRESVKSGPMPYFVSVRVCSRYCC